MEQTHASDLSAVIDCTLAQIDAITAGQARLDAVVRDLEEAWRTGRAAQEENAREARELAAEMERLRHEGTEGWQGFLRGVTSDLERQRDKNLRRWAGLEANIQRTLDGLHEQWEQRWNAFMEQSRSHLQAHLDQQASDTSVIAQAAQHAWEQAAERLTADCAELQDMINADLERVQGEVKKALAEVRSDARAHAQTLKKRHLEITAEVEKAEATQAKVLKDVNTRVRTLGDQVKEMEHVIASVDGRVQQVTRQRANTDAVMAALTRRIDALVEESAQHRAATDELGRKVQAMAAVAQRLETRMGQVTETLPALQDELKRLEGSSVLRLLLGRRKSGAGEND